MSRTPATRDLRTAALLHRKAPAAAGLAAALVVPGALAQEPVVMDEMVVTAAGYEQQVEQAPASISVISRQQLEEHQYRDVTDALRSVPGVVVTGGGAGDNGADISIRGMPSEYTLLLVDGRRVSTRETRPNGSAGFEQDWLPPLQAIERIEVVRGPMSTLYGSDAIGGVVNIITRKVAAQWHGSLQASTVIQEDDDSGNAQQANFYLSGPLVQDRLGLQLFGEASARQEDEIVDGYEDKHLQSLTARLAWAPLEDHEVTLEAGATEQTRRSTVGMTTPTTGCRGGCEGSENEFSRRHYAVGHTGRWDFGTSQTYVQREVAENESREMQITNTELKTSAVMPLGDHIVTAGASYSQADLEDATSNRISDLTEIDSSQWAVFAEDEWLLTDTFALTGGLRLDHNENYGSHVSPRLYGVWGFQPRWTLKGGVSTGYRSPDLRELTPDWGQVSRGGNVYGNPNLEPETSVNTELALLYNAVAGVEAGLTLFYNDFQDKITRVQCPATICTDGPNQWGRNPTYRINVDEAVTRGAEFLLAAPLGDRVDAAFSYTYTDSEQKSGEYRGEPLTQLPRHLASAELDWQATARLSPWARVTYRGEESQPNTGPSQDALIAPSHTFVDLGVGYQVSDDAVFSVGLYNVLDKEITAEEYGYVEDGRRLWLSLAADF